MKKLSLTLILLVFTLMTNAQATVFFKVKEAINLTHPEINLENKLIALTIWSVGDAESRETNKSFDKACKVYELAKLKGGSNGIVAVSFNKENLSSMASIAFQKDGITKVVALKLEDVPELNGAQFSNMVFNSDGVLVYKDLPASKVFESINNLITR
jgi:hypothetical protein